MTKVNSNISWTCRPTAQTISLGCSCQLKRRRHDDLTAPRVTLQNMGEKKTSLSAM